MRSPVKLALIGGEVTLLAAFTGLGIHLAMQPHRVAFRPPALVLPTSQVGVQPVLPALPAPLQPPPSPPVATPTATPFAPALFAKFGEQDRNLLIQQWDILRRLTRAVESYVESRVLQQFDKPR